MPTILCSRNRPSPSALSTTTASRLASERGWSIVANGEHYRRVVASPERRSIVELATLRLLVRAGVLVIRLGGGIPVIIVERHRLRGVEAVVDKDLSAALLATQLEADGLHPDVTYVEADWRTPRARPLTHVTTPGRSGSLADQWHQRSRLPAALSRPPGAVAAIGALEDAVALADGHHGTQVIAGNTEHADHRQHG